MMLSRFVIKRSKDQAQLQSALQKSYSELKVKSHMVFCITAALVSESVISSAIKSV